MTVEIPAPDALRNQLCKTLGLFLDELEREGDVGASRTDLMLGLGETLAAELKLDEAATRTLRNAIRVSAAAKLGLPHEIATTRGLTEEQLNVVRATLLKNVGYLKATGVLEAEAQTLEHVYEWWDGSGMPHGKAGEEIPVLSRALAVLVAFSTLREGSSHTNMHGREEAMGILWDGAGSHFEQDVVEAFDRVLDEYYKNQHDIATGHLLLIDDDEHMRMVMERRLEWNGYQVLSCGSIRAARQDLTSQPWTAILVDMMMPEEGGLEFLQELRSHEDFRDTPVVMMTCYADRDHMNLADEAGADAYAVKPVPFERLLQYLGEVDATGRGEGMVVFERE